MNRPEIALITPVYNTGEIILETAESVLGQSFQGWEWIIVDDGSDEETYELLRQVEQRDDRIQLLRQQNKLAPAARNLGVQNSEAPFLKFLDADDLLGENLLQVQIEAARQQPDQVVFSESLILIDLPGQEKRLLPTAGKDLISDDLLLSHLMDRSGYPGSFLFPRSIVEKIGPWDESLIADQDGDYIMRAGFYFPKTVVADGAFFKYRHHAYTNRVSVGFTPERLESRIHVCEKIGSMLIEADRLAEYSIPLAQRLDALARVASVDFEVLSKRALRLAESYHANYPSRDPWYFNLSRQVLGLSKSERIKRILRRQ